MKLDRPNFEAPPDAIERKAVAPVICYPPDSLAPPDLAALQVIKDASMKTVEVKVAPRDAACCEVPAGAFFRITSVEGPQVGDLNLWNADELSERFYSGKTRALHGDPP